MLLHTGALGSHVGETLTLILNDADVADLLPWAKSLEVCEEAYRELAFGRAATYTRRDVSFPGDGPDSVRRFITMEGGIEKTGVVAQRVDVETVTKLSSGGAKKQIEVPITPTGRWVGLVYLYSIKNGELLAIMTDGEIQRVRVAATSAVGVKYMSRPDSSTLGLLGAGQQAESHVRAIAATRGITRAKVYSPTRSKREAFCQTLAKDTGIDLLPVDSPQEAVKGADIVAAATSAREPVCRGEWAEEGQHLGSIVAGEFDEDVWRRADVAVCSNREKGEVRAVGDTARFAPRAIPAPYEKFGEKIRDLTALLRGEFAGREKDTDVTVFLKGLGLGIEFAAVGKVVYDEALKHKRGREIPSDWFTQSLHT